VREINQHTDPARLAGPVLEALAGRESHAQLHHVFRRLLDARDDDVLLGARAVDRLRAQRGATTATR
jgi:hypothetical protein